MPKKSLLVTIYANPDVYPPTISAVRILARDFRVRIVSRNSNEPAASWPSEVEIERTGPAATAQALIAASPLSKARDFLRYLTALRRAIALSRPALIVAYDPIAFAATTMVRHAIPVVFHCHDAPVLAELQVRSLQSWLIRYALRRTRDAAVVVFPEKHRAAYWLDAAGDGRAPVIVPNGAPRGFFHAPEDWSALALKRFSRRTALYMGWISSTHGELAAVRATALTADARLAMIGTPREDFREELNRAVARSGGRVELHPWTSTERDQLIATSALGLVLYKSISLNWEFSASAVNKLFEYGAAGLPVVVPDRESYREFLDGEEWVAFADVENPASIARAIDSILADRDRYLAMSRAARAAHEQRLSYELLFASLAARIQSLTASLEGSAAALQ